MEVIHDFSRRRWKIEGYSFSIISLSLTWKKNRPKSSLFLEETFNRAKTRNQLFSREKTSSPWFSIKDISFIKIRDKTRASVFFNFNVDVVAHPVNASRCSTLTSAQWMKGEKRKNIEIWNSYRSRRVVSHSCSSSSSVHLGKEGKEAKGGKLNGKSWFSHFNQQHWKS